MSTAAIIDIILSLATRMQAAASLIIRARAENREISNAELDALAASDDAARAALVDAIAAAKVRESGDTGGG